MSLSDDILERLVDLDRKACAMVDDAQEQLDDTLSNMERDVARFREEYAQRATRRIGIIRDEEGRASEEALENISRRYQSLMDGLEESYRANHEKWEEEIFQRCIQK